ncbi:MAG: GntR family transcriptional regulator [Clostridia bacterium]|nr:GntR family transcriptional regulator [Clostridia bacterium]
MEQFEAYEENNSLSLRGRVFVKIENDILNGKYQPGESLNESKVAGELKVSRTPVREAIRQLELEGLVAYIPNKGAIVKGLSIEDVRDIFEIRMKIEGLAAKRAASNITESQLKELREVVEFEEFYTAKGDTEQILKLDTKFHEIIFRASGSRLLDRTLTSFHHYIQRARSFSLMDAERAKKALLEHMAIMKAIESRDKERAEVLMANHILNASENIGRLKGYAYQEEK